MYIKVPEEEYPEKSRVIEIIDDIENSELSIIELQKVDDQRRQTMVDATRRKQLIANELKLRINRLTEEY